MEFDTEKSGTHSKNAPAKTYVKNDRKQNYFQQPTLFKTYDPFYWLSQSEFSITFSIRQRGGASKIKLKQWISFDKFENEREY